jgi:hypothetical protein
VRPRSQARARGLARPAPARPVPRRASIPTAPGPADPPIPGPPAAPGPGRSKTTPRSRSETYASWPMTRWSSRSMSSSRPAASASAVRWRSSGDGVGSPLGWLWTRMTPAASARTASRKSSPIRTSEVLTLPTYAVVTRSTRFFALSRMTRSSSRSSRPIWRMRRSATSRGVRIVQRPVGQSARRRRPSSNDATSWAARAGPIPGTAASSTSLARATPVSPSKRASASPAISIELRPAVPELHTSPISSAADSPAAPRSARRSRGRSSAGSSRIRRPRTTPMGMGSLTVAPRRFRRPDAGSRRPRTRTTEPADSSAVRMPGTRRQ